MLAASEIKKIQKILAKTEPNIKNRCNFHYLSSDPTRLKILMLLKKHSEFCVSDLAKILEVSISAISHQLKLLENCRLVKSVKTGKTVYYSLTIKNLDLNIKD
ncbi:MAG: metalloregulator ArsR/SmtB family transcription factor [Patescibacteria group bacterium]|jgi:ArsR family transcriptional regulator|nr:metalloregulator ArsR/SmtB family transcription factor [Patescibacteria group bacterium]